MAELHTQYENLELMCVNIIIIIMCVSIIIIVVIVIIIIIIITSSDVVPLYCNISVSVNARLFMIKSSTMHHFMNDNAFLQTSVCQ